MQHIPGAILGARTTTKRDEKDTDIRGIQTSK
jgi:hypothetical protein